MGLEWRAVVGYEGLYEISSEGGVRSLGRVVKQPHRLCPYPAKVLKQETLTKRPYKRVSLVDSKGVRKKHLVHTLVLEAFIGPRPAGHEACHNNGDCSDNRVDNLRWDTPSNNTRDKIKHGTHNWLRSRGGVIPDNYYDKENHSESE